MIYTLTLPLARRSPLVIPHRDLVLNAAESVLLQVTLVAEDKPTAAAVDLSGVGLRLLWRIWREAQVCDYGITPFGTAQIYATEATFPNAVAGRADLTIPAGALPVGSAWHALTLDYSGASTSVACGTLQVQPGPLVGEVLSILTDDNGNVIEV